MFRDTHTSTYAGCCHGTVEGRDQAEWRPGLTSCPASQVTTRPLHTTNFCWQLMISWIPPAPTVLCGFLCFEVQTLLCIFRNWLYRPAPPTLTLNHLVPAFDPPVSSGWRLPSASPKPSSEGLDPTGLGAKRWKRERSSSGSVLMALSSLLI